MTAPSLAGLVENRLTGETFSDRASCLRSLLANNQLLLESLYPALGGNHAASNAPGGLLRSSDVGVVRLPLQQVTVAC